LAQKKHFYEAGQMEEITVEVERLSLLTAKEAAQFLHVSLLTLSKIEKDGGLIPFRTPGGHRRYSLDMLNEYLQGSRDNRRRGNSN
jgi:excisionase family DNA binding protein